MKLGDNYSVYGFMTRELGLKGAELQVFALIYSFTRATGEFSGSRSYIATRVGITERTVDRAMRELVLRGLVERLERRDGNRLRSYITIPRRALAYIGELMQDTQSAG